MGDRRNFHDSCAYNSTWKPGADRRDGKQAEPCPKFQSDQNTYHGGAHVRTGQAVCWRHCGIVACSNGAECSWKSSVALRLCKTGGFPFGRATFETSDSCRDLARQYGSVVPLSRSLYHRKGLCRSRNSKLIECCVLHAFFSPWPVNVTSGKPDPCRSRACRYPPWVMDARMLDAWMLGHLFFLPYIQLQISVRRVLAGVSGLSGLSGLSGRLTRVVLGPGIGNSKSILSLR